LRKGRGKHWIDADEDFEPREGKKGGGLSGEFPGPWWLRGKKRGNRPIKSKWGDTWKDQKWGKSAN